MAHLDPTKPHHTMNGFRNNHPHDSHEFVDVLKWRWDRLFARSGNGHASHGYHFPVASNDPLYLRHNGQETTLTWIGHSTLLLQLDGLNILTDPHLTERASPLSWMGPKRLVPPGLTFEELPRIDVVLISHNHYDHLDLNTVRRLSRHGGNHHRPRFIVPLGIKAFLEQEGINNIVELDWWQQARFRNLTIHSVPAQHFSARTPFDKNQTLWSGYVVVHPEFRFYFAGDTGYSPDFKTIGARFGPLDLAALPIGAYEPRWFMRAMHVNPEEAIQIHQDVRARYSVAIHWGTFELTDEPMDEPPKRLRAALRYRGISEEDFFVMQHGETRRLGSSEMLTAKETPCQSVYSKARPWGQSPSSPCRRMGSIRG